MDYIQLGIKMELINNLVEQQNEQKNLSVIGLDFISNTDMHIT